MSADGWAERLCLAWVDLYTRGLPEPDASWRRAELASDLHEHGQAAAERPRHQLDVLGRVLWGIPADLSWRRAALAPQRRLQTGAAMTLRRLATGLIVFVALFNLWAGLGVVFGGDAGLQYLVGMWAGAALIAIGLWQWGENARLGTVLMVVGAAAPMVIFYWMAPIFVPFWIGVSALVIAAEPGRRQPTPTPAA